MLRVLVLVGWYCCSIANAGDITLDDARQASVADTTRLVPFRCRGTFRVSRQDRGATKPIVWTDGAFRLSHAPGKLRLDMRFHVRKARVSIVDNDGKETHQEVANSPVDIIVLDDGTAISKVTFSPRIMPSGCRIELYSSLRAALSGTGFPLRNPVHPQRDVLDVDALVRNLGADAVKWSKQDGTFFQGDYHLRNTNRVRAEFQVDAAMGNRVVSKAVFNFPADSPAAEHRLKWAKADDTWYVKSLSWTKRYANQPVRRAEVVFLDYQPNAEFMDDEFSLSSASIPDGARTLDRRQ